MNRRKVGAQGWCGPGVCVLSEEPKPGRNETAWVHMRNCLHTCNRTQVRPATEACDEAKKRKELWKRTSWTLEWEGFFFEQNESLILSKTKVQRAHNS